MSVDRKTLLSGDRLFRYTLWREWDLFNRTYAMFVGLNPSTADETNNDNTIRRCIAFSTFWGFGALCMTNLFAYRTKSPEIMKQQADPVGPDNDKLLVELAKGAGVVVAAWGVDGPHLARDAQVYEMLGAAGIQLHCLGVTKDGHPRHPLYVRGDTRPTPWRPAAASLVNAARM